MSSANECNKRDMRVLVRQTSSMSQHSNATWFFPLQERVSNIRRTKTRRIIVCSPLEASTRKPLYMLCSYACFYGIIYQVGAAVLSNLVGTRHGWHEGDARPTRADAIWDPTKSGKWWRIPKKSRGKEKTASLLSRETSLAPQSLVRVENKEEIQRGRLP